MTSSKHTQVNTQVITPHSHGKKKEINTFSQKKINKLKKKTAKNKPYINRDTRIKLTKEIH